MTTGTVHSELDRDALTLTFVADFTSAPSRVWQIFEDPQLLSRWWGPPTWPATFHRHDFVEGGESAYYMTGPDGEQSHGWWEVVTIDAPRRLVFDDGFSDKTGARVESMPITRSSVTLEDRPEGGTHLTSVTTFASADQLDQLLEMGLEEGEREAMGQISEVLGED